MNNILKNKVINSKKMELPKYGNNSFACSSCAACATCAACLITPWPDLEAVLVAGCVGVVGV